MKRTIIAFIGSAGIPNKYGGFEAFLEHCAPEMARRVDRLIVTCDAQLYEDQTPLYQGVERIFLKVRANGGASIFHDLIAFLRVFPVASHIVVLGVSGGIWFPLFRLLCAAGGRTLAVNVDGVEWQRGKFSRFRKSVLRLFDAFAQVFANRVIIDNEALRRVLVAPARDAAVCIAYPGDHVIRIPGAKHDGLRTGLTVCRIEPENNIEAIIEGVLQSQMDRHTIIGNWKNSDYGKALLVRYGDESRIEMLDPIYDQNKLAAYREACSIYIHGHSVGGTNPSLVEILFYDCAILCLDVPYHHQTAGDCAQYFSDPTSLAHAIDNLRPVDHALRSLYRKRYLRSHIADQYLASLGIAQ